jgi:drug/metabolite transporter (DMT)-like permease
MSYTQKDINRLETMVEDAQEKYDHYRRVVALGWFSLVALFVSIIGFAALATFAKPLWETPLAIVTAFLLGLVATVGAFYGLIEGYSTEGTNGVSNGRRYLKKAKKNLSDAYLDYDGK